MKRTLIVAGILLLCCRDAHAGVWVGSPPQVVLHLNVFYCQIQQWFYGH